MQYLLAITYTVFFIFLIFRLDFFKCEGLSGKAISSVFILKLISGVLLWVIYTWYYDDRQASDSFKYFDDAGYMFEALKTNPIHYFQMLTGVNADADHLMVYYQKMSHWFKPYDYGIYNDNRTVIRVIGLFYPFSFGFYAVQVVFFCFLSLIGLVAIFKTTYPFLKNKAPELFIVIFLLPSVIFWTSGVLKEGILIFAFGLFLYFFWKVLFGKPDSKQLVWIVSTFLLLVLIKGYVLLALIPAILSLLIIRISRVKYCGIKFAATHLFLLIIAVNLYRLDPQLDVLNYIHQKQRDFLNVSAIENPGSFIEIKIFEPEWKSLISNTPEAIFNVLVRPFILEGGSILILFAAAENFIILIIAVISVFFWKKIPKDQLPLFCFSLFFTLSLAAIIGYITPVLGAVVRYKIPLLPFLLLVFLIPVNKAKLLKKIKILKFLDRNRI